MTHYSTSMNARSTFKLINGVEIPVIGFGTWQTPDGEVAVSAVKQAITDGYRHIDCAAVYGNEKSVGQGIAEGIKAAGITREQLFVTSKVWNTEEDVPGRITPGRNEAGWNAPAGFLSKLSLYRLPLND